MAQVTSTPDEISAFIAKFAEGNADLPQVINLAFSADRRSEAWHVRLTNKQVGRGFNKAAPVTMMLAMKSWKKLMKKNAKEAWRQALADGQIHLHGDKRSIAALTGLFSGNGAHTESDSEQSATG